MLFLMMLIDSEEERSKFEIIYKTYRNLMFHIARRILGNEADAEDAVQEAFLRIIENFEKFPEAKCLKTKHSCVIIVKRIAIDMLRRRKVRANEVDPGIIEELFEDPEMTDQLVAVEENTDLAAALTSLPERYREAVLLRYSDEYSFEEIAQIMGITEANARKIVQRACKKLRVTMRVSEAERKENQDK